MATAGKRRAPGRPSDRHAVERRRRLARRAAPFVAAVVLVGLLPGAIVGARAQSGSERLAASFADAWERRDYQAMYALLAPETQRDTSLKAFERAYEEALATATATDVEAGDPREDGDLVGTPIAVGTRVFGTVRGELRLPVAHGPVSWADERIAWETNLVFPDLPASERLRRESETPQRAEIRADDGTSIATGGADDRRSASGRAIAGEIGTARDRSERDALYARGFPRDTAVGLTGVERALDPLVAGTPGGTLLAGDRVLASSAPRAAAPVATTIDADMQETAVDALAGRRGGVAALDARDGAVRALAGRAVSDPRAPGSAFKIVTATAALEAGVAKPASKFPYRTLEKVERRDLDAVTGDPCGGTLRAGFVESCNSLFAAVGLEVGAERLVATAEQYGFNARPAIPGAVASTLPAADDVASSLDRTIRRASPRVALAETAIGQGLVYATPLELASIAQAIAAEGLRAEPRLLQETEPSPPTRVASPSVARAIEELMVGVVAEGTGGSAALGAGQVAGKTGTNQRDRESEAAQLADADTDAWFTAYAPVSDPSLAVAVLLRRAGSGGQSAAPTAREVLAAGALPP